MGKRIYIKWEHEKAAASQVGSKSYKLTKLRKKGIKTPQGFTLITKAFLDFIAHNAIYDKLKKLISDIPSDAEAIKNRSQDLRHLFTEARIPDKMSNEITSSCRRLTASFKEKICFAVRSSSVVEDSKSASFAGVYDTFLGLSSLDEVLKGIKDCWQSAFSPRVLTYLKKIDIRINDPEEIAMGVIVQKMINQKFAGVMITVNPVNGDSSKVLIEYSDKAEDFVVSGKCTPERLLVDKITNEINKATVSEKSEKNLLGEKYIHRLVGLGKKIEKYFGSYQDIEWVIDKDSSFPKDIVILQARPETIWNERHLKPFRSRGENILNFIPRVRIREQDIDEKNI
jgi:pyruvate,water dikinase